MYAQAGDIHALDAGLRAATADAGGTAGPSYTLAGYRKPEDQVKANAGLLEGWDVDPAITSWVTSAKNPSRETRLPKVRAWQFVGDSEMKVPNLVPKKEKGSRHGSSADRRGPMLRGRPLCAALALTSGDDQHRDCDRDRRRLRRRTRRRTDQALSQETSAMDSELAAIDVALIAPSRRVSQRGDPAGVRSGRLCLRRRGPRRPATVRRSTRRR